VDKCGICGICGGTIFRESNYKSRDAANTGWLGLPGIECMTCGVLRPDALKIQAMRDGQVPSSLRIRCAKMIINDTPID
jgi:hypothetical protein